VCTVLRATCRTYGVEENLGKGLASARPGKSCAGIINGRVTFLSSAYLRKRVGNGDSTRRHRKSLARRAFRGGDKEDLGDKIIGL
jgi:hypothetical protein